MLQGGVGRPFAHTLGMEITPFLMALGMYLSTSSYTETGAGAANLASNGEEYWSGEAGFEKTFSDQIVFFANATAAVADNHQSVGGTAGIKVSF
jgi:hypothetical protein